MRYRGGGADTVKTQIIRHIKLYFQESHMDQRLKVGAYTASVAILIGGSTIHSLARLAIDKSINSLIVKSSTKN